MSANGKSEITLIMIYVDMYNTPKQENISTYSYEMQ